MSKGSLISLYYKIERDSLDKYGEKSVVFMQKGTFYELYSARESFPQLCDLLNLYCTRPNNKKEFSPSTNPMMAGFQKDNVERYIKILLEKNYTITIVDEKVVGYKGKNADKKDIIREVSRIISVSTHVDSPESNPLVVVYVCDDVVSITYIELVNGKTILYTDCKLTTEYIREVLAQTNPREVVFYFNTEKELQLFSHDLNLSKTNEKVVVFYKVVEKEICRISYQNEFLNKVYKNRVIGLSPIEFLHLEKYPTTSIALVLLLQFALDHDSAIVSNLKPPETVCDNKTLILSENCINQLHINQLIKHVDFSQTAMGSRLIRERIIYPSTSPNILNKRYSGITLLKNSKITASLKAELAKIGDIDKYQRKLSSLKLQVLEIVSFYNTLKSTMNVFNIYKSINGDSINQATVNNLGKLIRVIEKSINIENVSDRVFNEGIYNDLDELYTEMKNLTDEFASIRLNISEIVERTLEYGTTNNSLYLIIKKKEMVKVKDNTDLQIKSTKTECRISTNRIDEISSRQNEIMEELTQLNEKYFREFCSKLIDKYSPTIIKIGKLIAEIDFAYVGCALINEYRFSIPTISTDEKDEKDEKNINSQIVISGLRHPLIESQISASYVANDVLFNDDNLGVLLYGENYSGKTSYIRSIGIAIVLAQAGLPVPASSMKYSPITRLITKIDLGDNYERSQSTFTKEIQKIKEMIECTDEYSLILADELCSGTEINSALALVASTILSIVKRRCRFIFTTHYHDLVSLPQIASLTTIKVYHMKVSIVGGKQVFDRLLQSGKCNDTYGIEIAQYMKMSSEFIHQAYMIRKEIMGIRGYVSTKQSRYNKDIYMTECRICKSTSDLHTHHIIFQKEFGGKAKNFKSNLVVLCEECHTKVHQGSLNIGKFVQTNE